MRKRITQELAPAAGEDPRAEADWILCHVLRTGRGELLADPRRVVTGSDLRAIQRLVDRRRRGVPLQQALGTWDFHGITLLMAPGVFIPRPETETLVDTVLARTGIGQALHVIDLGTGTGAIPLALKARRPGWEVFSVDLSRRAVALAGKNCCRLALPVHLLLADFRRPLPLKGPFDILVSNPPYIPRGDIPDLDPVVREHDPRRALDGGPDGLSLVDAVLRRGREILSPGGFLFMEIGHDQGARVLARMEAAGFTPAPLVLDLNRRPRVAWGRWSSGELPEEAKITGSW